VAYSKITAVLFSANKNVDMQDVSLIASGGEIARLMLAVKSLFAEYLKLPTIIFDEIDTGVSGHIAEKMAFVMKKMSANCQVLCITHLPQIAAEGNKHYRIYKLETSDETTSHICCLTTEDRIIEIAKMLSGSEISDTAIENAKSLLKL
jgi:DNA repair protein RecN (Recombination protein N)